jgi:competence protein ComEC
MKVPKKISAKVCHACPAQTRVLTERSNSEGHQAMTFPASSSFKTSTGREALNRKHLASRFVALAFFSLAVFLAGCSNKKDELAWTSIDLTTPSSQAEANLLTFNITNHILVDTGLNRDSARLIDFLKSRKCRAIQSVIITHGHQDHYGGLVPLLKSGIAVGGVYFNPPPASLVTNEPWGCSSEEISGIITELRQRNIPLKSMEKGTEWSLGKDAVMRVICVFDGLNTPAGRTDINDTSAIIMLSHGKNRFLFAADLNRVIGNYLATNCPPGMLRADILKFPHHGTESFPEDAFFAAVNAGTFIVPAPKELWLSERSARARQLTRGRKVYVNGAEGNITVFSDGNSFRIISDASAKNHY